MTIKSASSLEVAKRAGVSQATVSYVLNKRGDQSISETTRERVLSAAKELNYRPNRLANAVLRGKSNIVGVITTYLTSDYHARVMTGICEVLSRCGYHTFVATARGNEAVQRDVELMLEHRVEGIIWIANKAPWLREMIAGDVPWVIVDDDSLADIADCVISNDVLGMRQAIDHLVGLGHRRIALWTKVWDGSSYRDRCRGYEIALKANDIAVAPDLVQIFPEDPKRTGIELHKFLNLPDPPTAIVFTNDIAAMLTRQAAKEIGVLVPEDVALVGYSDQDYAFFNDLTTVSQLAPAMGSKAASQLIRRMTNPGLATGVHLTATELVVRSSTVLQPPVLHFYPLSAESTRL